MENADEIYVRTGVPEDEDGIMELARLVNIENGIFQMNEDKVLSMVRPALYLHGGIMGVIGDKEHIQGAILLRISNFWYSDAPFLEEMCVFVHPEYRAAKGGSARKLVEFAKQASEKLGMPLMIGILSNTRTDAKMRLYERQFGDPAGAFFLYGVRTGNLAQQEMAS